MFENGLALAHSLSQVIAGRTVLRRDMGEPVLAGMRAWLARRRREDLVRGLQWADRGGFGLRGEQARRAGESGHLANRFEH